MRRGGGVEEVITPGLAGRRAGIDYAAVRVTGDFRPPQALASPSASRPQPLISLFTGLARLVAVGLGWGLVVKRKPGLPPALTPSSPFFPSPLLITTLSLLHRLIPCLPLPLPAFPKPSPFPVSSLTALLAFTAD